MKATKKLNTGGNVSHMIKGVINSKASSSGATNDVADDVTTKEVGSTSKAAEMPSGSEEDLVVA